MKTVTKPWGKEEWLELNEKYCYKRIYINPGYKTSFQYHEKKRETIQLLKNHETFDFAENILNFQFQYQ